MNQRNGGQILVQTLLQHQVDTIYCVPGESFLPVLDALRETPQIKTIITRHEGAASNMADAYGKLTARPGVAFVTRGPGATHAANGVHTAMQDSTPMVLFIGQVETSHQGREAFQEVDYTQMFGSMAKWVVQVDATERIPVLVQRAFHVAQSGRAGPVVVALPEDILFGAAEVGDVLPTTSAPCCPDGLSMARLEELLQQAQRPLVVVGGTPWRERDRAHLESFIRAFNLPVAAGFRRQDVLDNRDAHYVGQLGLAVSPALAQRVRDADLIMAIGSRLSDVTTSGYTLIEAPQPKQRVLHIHPDAQELGKVFRTELAIQSDIAPALEALAQIACHASAQVWDAWTAQARAEYVTFNTVTPAQLNGVNLSSVVSYLSQTLPDDAIICNGAGNYTVWVHRFFQYKQLHTELAPTNGAMGYGLPAAIAAKLQHMDKTVVCFSGDGCFMMYPQELATAVQYGAAVIVLVVNNQMLGTIRMHQEREYPGRVIGTDLVNPDFVKLAQAFGCYAERVVSDDAFAGAFERACLAGKPAVLEILTDPLQITPGARLSF